MWAFFLPSPIVGYLTKCVNLIEFQNGFLIIFWTKKDEDL